MEVSLPPQAQARIEASYADFQLVSAPQLSAGQTQSFLSAEPKLSDPAKGGIILVSSVLVPSDSLSIKFTGENSPDSDPILIYDSDGNEYNLDAFHEEIDEETLKNSWKLWFGEDEEGKIRAGAKEALESRGIIPHGAVKIAYNDNDELCLYFQHKRVAESISTLADGFLYKEATAEEERTRRNVLSAVARWAGESGERKKEFLKKLRPDYAYAGILAAGSAFFAARGPEAILDLVLKNYPDLLPGDNSLSASSSWTHLLGHPLETMRLLAATLACGASAVTLLDIRERLGALQNKLGSRLDNFLDRADIARFYPRDLDDLETARNNLLAGFDIIDTGSKTYTLDESPILAVPVTDPDNLISITSDKDSREATITIQNPNGEKYTLPPDSFELIESKTGKLQTVFAGTDKAGRLVLGTRNELFLQDIHPEFSFVFQPSDDQIPAALMISQLEKPASASLLSEGLLAKKSTKEEAQVFGELTSSIKTVREAKLEARETTELLIKLSAVSTLALAAGIGIPTISESLKMDHLSLSLPFVDELGRQVTGADDGSLLFYLMKNRFLDEISAVTLSSLSYLTASSALLVKSFTGREIRKKEKQFLVQIEDQKTIKA